MLLLKTHGSNLQTVILTGLHALDKKPDLKHDEIILLSQTIATLGQDQQPIRYAARFGGFVEDTEKISDRLWGKHWKYLLLLGARWTLASPFRIRDVQVTDAEYGQGGPYAHLTELDEAAVRNRGLLRAESGSSSQFPIQTDSQLRVANVFQRLWSLAAGLDGYVKKDWLELEAALRRGDELR